MAEQLPLKLPVLSDYGEDAFLIAGSNRQAVHWIDRWPDWPERRLLLLGPPGSGKTHLARIWARRAGARSLAGAALQRSALPEPGQGPAGPAWLVEDLPQLADPQALLHLVNAAMQAGGHLLLTSSVAPARLGLALPDLASRLATFSLAQIQPPEEDLLAGVLWKLFADRQLRVGPRTIRFLVPRMPRSLGAAVRLVEALDRAALAEGAGVTLALARRVLQAEYGEDAA